MIEWIFHFQLTFFFSLIVHFNRNGSLSPSSTRQIPIGRWIMFDTNVFGSMLTHIKNSNSLDRWCSLISTLSSWFLSDFHFQLIPTIFMIIDGSCNLNIFWFSCKVYWNRDIEILLNSERFECHLNGSFNKALDFQLTLKLLIRILFHKCLLN